MWALDSFFAGLWSQIWHWGTSVGLLVLLGVAWFFLKDERTHLAWAALVIVGFLAGQSLGAHDQARKDEARKVVIERQVEAVVEKSKTPKAKSKRDRWDRPEY